MKRATMRARSKRRAKPQPVLFGEQAAACRLAPCCACGTAGRSEPHHEPPRSLGGKDEGTLPVCSDCHTLGPEARHRIGLRAWAEHWKIDVDAVKTRMRERVGRAA